MQKSAKITSRHLVLAAAVLLVLALLFWVALTRNIRPVDWQNTYYPAARALLALQSPYARTPLFFAPAWSLLPLGSTGNKTS